MNAVDKPARPSASDTIFALSSAAGRAAVAVVRMSGQRSASVIEAMTGHAAEHRRARLRVVRHPETHAHLDRAVILFFAGPASETGEDIAEFQLHGSRAVVAAVLGALATIPGCRPALPGEFARRAFDNGKIDLTAVEGLADLIDAETEGQRVQALAQASGALGRLYGGWRSELIQAQALVEAAIDFADEGDVGDGAYDLARGGASRLATAMSAHLGQAHRGEILRSGFRVVLAGPPNVGKSSLLNALARRDAAIVSAEPGTTRDVVEVRLDLGGIPVLVSDTAGIREACNDVEREGIRRSLARVREADLVLWLQVATVEAVEAPGAPSASGGAPPQRLADMVTVATKLDLLPSATSPHGVDLAISAATGAGLGSLIDLIVAKAQQAVGDGGQIAPTQARHRAHLMAAQQHLGAFLDGAQADLELRAEDLRLAAHELGRLTGRIDPEDVLGEIFGRFCIGK